MAEFVTPESLMTEARDPGFIVAIRGGESIDFAAFADGVARWRTGFERSPCRRVALHFKDSAEFAAALFGAWHAGKCVFLPSDALPLTVARLRERVDAFAGDFPPSADVVTRGEAGESRDSQWRGLDPAAQSLVVYTSGSSGEPVAIPKQLGQLFREVATLAAAWDSLLGDARVLATVSHQHIYGLLFRVLWPLASGRPFAATRLAFAEDIAAALASTRPAALVASPAHLKRLPHGLPWAVGGANLHAVFSSGGPLPDEALPDCRALLGRAPIEVFGSSETGGIAWRQRETDAALPWQPLPGVEVRVEGATLWVRSPHLPDSGWHATADRARAGAEGFELLGRADRIVKVEERRVSLEALERALVATGLVSAAGIAMLPGERRPLGVVAVPTDDGWAMVERGGKLALIEALRDALSAVAESGVLPRRWRLRWALPMDSQGKTTEAALVALFDPRRPAARLMSSGADKASLRIEVDAGSPFFDGHFPGSPILPGVAQVDWVIRFSRELFPVPPAFARLEALKFQSVIVPGEDIAMDLRFECASACVRFRIHSGAGLHAQGRVVFGTGA